MRKLIFVGAGIIVLGMGYYLAILTSKAFKPKIVVKTEKVTCPEATAIKLLDFNKFNSKKSSVNISPQISNVTLMINGSDTLFIDRIADAVARKIELEIKRKRR
jgi:hypothetical protein